MEKKWKDESKNDDYEIYQYEKERIGKENWKKMLENTSLNESEYINMLYAKKTKIYERLIRDKGDFIN